MSLQRLSITLCPPTLLIIWLVTVTGMQPCIFARPVLLLCVAAHDCTQQQEWVTCWACKYLAHVLFMNPAYLQDYVKWRGPLFHRFLLALVDDSPSVCALAEYLLTDTLASKVSLCMPLAFTLFSVKGVCERQDSVLFAMSLCGFFVSCYDAGC